MDSLPRPIPAAFTVALQSASPAARCAPLALVLLATGCATLPPPDPSAATALLDDTRFAAVALPVTAAEVFALSDEMRHFADQALRGPGAAIGPGAGAPTGTRLAVRGDARRRLLQALYGNHALRYDASATRTASEAWAARSGNCLSLVVMTAAFARHLGLPVSYRQVLVDDQYTQAGTLTLASGHVNLVLARPLRAGLGSADSDELTVDFLPPEQRRGQRSVPLAETTVVAMYMNNRAAEALTGGRVDEAYAWLRQALAADPGYAAAANTLAVVYERAGHMAQAEATLRTVLAREPRHVAALSNLVRVLGAQGRQAEASPWAARLAALQPVAPFHHLALGRAALAEGRLAQAREHFERELRLQPEQHEAHDALAQVLLRQGERAAASRHLALAAEYSPTPEQQGRYAAKLAHLRAVRAQ